MSLLDSTDQSTTTFDSLVGEGKKYKDNDAVAKAIAEKDRFIEQLKAEKAEVLRDLQTRPNADRSQEILDRLSELAKPAPSIVDTTSQERVEYKGLTEDDVFKLLARREAQSRADANLDKVKAELTSKYGDKYSQVLHSLQDKLGVDQKFLDDLAARSPTAFSSMLKNIDPSPQSVFTPPASSKPEAFQPSASGPKKRSEYLRLKAENYSLYNSPAVQNQMYKDSMVLGETFFDVPD
jgi:hypothetical protein